ncbi:MAG: hypothetical protein ABI556_15975 [Gemmatimonadales bacterium]
MDQDRVDEADGEVSTAGKSGLLMHYFDSRGVFRVHETSFDDVSWKWLRIAKGFSQRFTGTFDGGDTIVGLSELRRDDVHWEDDLKITYRRRK